MVQVLPGRSMEEIYVKEMVTQSCHMVAQLVLTLIFLAIYSTAICTTGSPPKLSPLPLNIMIIPSSIPLLSLDGAFSRPPVLFIP